MIDVANNYGLDKLLFSERIQWVMTNITCLESHEAQAESPALYHAAVKALRNAEKKIPSGYAVSFDATCSGIQVLSCLIGDRKAMEHVNLINNGKRNDFYTAAYEIFRGTCNEARAIERADLKQAVMTAFYCSEAVPKAVFGKGQLLQRFYETIAEEAPGCWYLNTLFKGLWDPEATRYDWVLPDNFHAHFKVEDEQVDVVSFMGIPTNVVTTIERPCEEGRSLGANITHSCDGFIAREMHRRCSYSKETYFRVLKLTQDMDNTNKNQETIDDNHTKMVQILWKHYLDSGFLSARILEHIFKHNVHLIDKKVILGLVLSLPTAPFKMFSTHDCFRCLPNHTDQLRWQYIKLMSQLAKSEMLSFILTQITGEECAVQKMDPNAWKDILDSEYALC